MKKRYLSLLLVLAMLLTACGASKESVSGSLQPAEKPAETVPAVTEPAETERPVSMGRMEGGTYTNSYTGFGCSLDSSWTFYTAEELQELPGNVKEILEGSELGDTINPLEQFTDMMAENPEELCTINVLYQKVPAENRMVYAVLDEETILEGVLQEKDAMIAAYAQGGFNVESIEMVKVTFLGEERAALKTASTTQDVPYYTLQLFDYKGAYSTTLTLASFVEDNTAGLLDLFFPVD